MANKDDYLTYYREFFENFAQTVNPNDQLPVKLASYKLINLEVIGGVIDWTTQYLTQKKCPQSLIAPLIQIVIEETRKTCKKQPTACGFNPSDNAYEPLKLMQTVMAKTNEICLRYLDNSMLCSLPSPGSPNHVVSVCAAKNKRRRMEDRHVVIHDLNTMFNKQEVSPSSYYAIFDGHAGHDAAAYSSAHLHQYLAESKHFVANPEQALLDAFCKTDALFIDKCNVERFNSGTTAVCALLRPKEKTLYIAWVGDSQALLVNQGRVLQCVNPHKPCRTDERERIEKEGGYVCYWGTWRVNGQLAVSRAIGDAEYKPYVIAVPDIREIPLDGGEDFLILACDGLWDFLSEDDAARTVYEMVCNNPDETDLISERLVYLSKERGSADNISVIVVFLREPSKIAAEAHWANRNTSAITMDTSLDNANNPFSNSNGADNNIIGQKSEGLLLNLSENFKHNGADLSPSGDFYHNSEKSNGKRLASEFDDDDDLGPETDVDTVDDVVSPSIAAAKALAEGIVNNNPDGSFNPFVEKHEVEKAALEIDLDLQKQQSSEFDGQRSPREETPTPPADAVHDGGLEENIGDSGEESEDEWNYIKGEEANKENISPSQPDSEVADLLDQEQDNMSQLNPNAAEFVPVSPTRSIPSPACRLMHDPVIAHSPKRPSEIDINLPNPQEFENEVKSRPSDTFSNGHDQESDEKPSSQEIMENLLNGKNIDEIPEFQPGNTPSKASSVSEEFHFGPNAAPFTPVKSLDQSEAALSTKALFGDESTINLDSTLDASRDNVDFSNKLKEEDPMSMSFYQDKSEGDTDPFDLNKVQVLPENLDAFLGKGDDNILHEDEVSDLPEHDTASDILSDEIIGVLNNDERIQTTDLDKVVDDEKELASPVSNDDDESSGICELSKSPQPHTDDLLAQFDSFSKESLPDTCLKPLSKSPFLDTEELQPEAVSPFSETLSPEPPTVSPAPERETLSPAPELQIVYPTPECESVSPAPEHEPLSEIISESALSPEPQALSPSPEPHAISPSPEPKVVSPSPEPQAFSPTPEPQVVSPSPEPRAVSPSPEPQAISPSPEPQAVSPSPEPLAVSPSPEPETRVPAFSPELEAPAPPQIVSPEPPVCKSVSPEPSEDVCQISKSPILQAISPEPSEDVCSLPKSPEPEKIQTPEPGPIIETAPKSEKIEAREPEQILETLPEPEKIEAREPEQRIETAPEPEKIQAPEPKLKIETGSEAEKIQTEEPGQLIETGPEPTRVVEESYKFEIDERKEVFVDSPLEDVTFSVKDVSSPVSSPIVDQVAADTNVLLNFAQEINNAVQSSVPVESSSPIRADDLGPEVCPLSTPKSVTDTESVATTDVNSFLERSEVADLTSPLSPGEPLFVCGTMNLDHPLAKCVYPLPTEIKTENITPEFAEPAVISPVETKEETPSVPSHDETVKEPEVAVEKTVPAATVAAAATAGLAATTLAAVAVAEKKTKTPTAAKRPAGKPTTIPSKSATSPMKTKPAPAAKAKPTTARTTPTAASRTTTGAVPKQAISRAAPKPKPSTGPAARTSTEKKPLTNGDVKAPARLSLTARKSTDGAKPATPKPATAPATKTSSTKLAAPKSTPASAKTSATRTAPTAAAPRTRPSTLASRTATSTVTKTLSATTAAKTSAPKTATSPKTMSPPKPRPTTAPAKPRFSITKTATKTSADAEKQNKESANKLTASRTVTSTRTSGAASARTISSTVRKAETKTTGTTRTTVTKTTTTTARPTAIGKKPLEITRTGNKTKTTKIEKPLQNGVTTVVTEQITTIVNNSVNESEPQLLKDNSPIDNKLIVDANAAD